MANKIYPLYKAAIMTATGIAGDVTNLLIADVKIALIDLADYTYDDSHEILSQVPTAAIVATSPSLEGVWVDPSACYSSNNVVLSAVTGDQSEALIMFLDTGDPTTSRLVAFLDTDVMGLPVTPNGGDISITVDPVAGWFTL